jgi:HK97 family phage major capsid protein
MAIGKKHGFDNEALNAIGDGKSPAQFRDYVLEELAKRGMKPAETKDVEIGLSEKEAESYSFMRVINALANPANKKAQDAAGFEFEASRAVADKIGSTPNGVFVPLDVQKRELTVGTATAGGHLVATELLTSSFIDLLQNRMLTKRMGARVLSGLVGDVAIPRQTGGATTYWVGESTDGTLSDQSFDQVALTPKTQAAITKISRKLLLQSSLDVEAFVRADLALAQALGGDLAAIAGAGGNDPLGIINTSGVGSVIGGTDGAAPTWDHIVQLWTEVAQNNADFGSLGYMTNSKVLGKLMQTEKASGTGRFIVEQFPDNDGFTGLAGSRAGVSNQVPGDLDKGSSAGVCSALIYGNWADLIIAMWGSLDIVVDGISSNDGGVTVKTYQDMDVAPRNAGSFSVMLDALTS